ncbi:hypothetical protein [Planomicrobium sp. CPCC 101079]|uniref:hypothetical protein n=1 Tax=Planomicrobium sp. CPCC 101079 TaxID=2599618 RepID=UPI0011B47163|nr:hypothetical protein [Planomicrobium sp. CPCC 101079]TWT00994.1 hypothetical protein FQV28_16520 [Planomicrobium sp. CPCC 101079]
MGNMQETINVLRIAMEGEFGRDNSLSFITPAGIYFGKLLAIKEETREPANADELVPINYSKANFYTRSELKSQDNHFLEDLDFSETILLEDVKFKTGKTVNHIKHAVLNINQIISVQLVANSAIDDVLKNY